MGGKFNLTLKGKMTSFSVVLGIFRPYFNSFRSYYVEMRPDNKFFGLFRGFLYEIGEIIVVLRNFRPYSRDFGTPSSGFRSDLVAVK